MTTNDTNTNTNPNPSPEQIAAARADLENLDDFFLREAADRAMADMQAACRASRGTWTPELAREAWDASARGQAAWELIRERAHAVHVERLAAGDPVALREREIARGLARDLGYLKPSEPSETEPERVGYTCKQCGGPAPMGVGYTSMEAGAWEASQGRAVCPCGASHLSEGLAPVETVTVSRGEDLEAAGLARVTDWEDDGQGGRVAEGVEVAWETARDYRERVVLPALGEWAGEHDVDAIVADMTTWAGGRLVEAPGLEFWEVVARHALVPACA